MRGNMETVLVEGAKIYGINVVRKIPASDLEDPGVIQLPSALVQKLEWAHGLVADAEGRILTWMCVNGIRPELAADLAAGYEMAREAAASDG
jgi:hypothetical protein